MFKSASFFSYLKIQQGGFNYHNLKNLYKFSGLPINFGKISKKEIKFIEGVGIKPTLYNRRRANIENSIKIGTLKSVKHIKNYPVNGQRNRTNAQTRKRFKII